MLLAGNCLIILSPLPKIKTLIPFSSNFFFISSVFLLIYEFTTNSDFFSTLIVSTLLYFEILSITSFTASDNVTDAFTFGFFVIAYIIYSGSCLGYIPANDNI